MSKKIEVPDLSGRKVFIATPAYEGKVGLAYMNSLILTLRALWAANAQAEYAVYANSGSVPRVRNQAVAQVLAGDYTDLLFIDADMGWQAQDVCRVLRYETDIVAGAYPARSQHNPRWIVVWPDEVKKHEPTGLLTAFRAGTGFMRIRRNVFEHLADARPDLKYEQPGMVSETEAPYLHAFFDYHLQNKPDGSRTHLSEDYAFCDMVREAGFTIWIDPQVHLQHIGTFTWEGKFADAVQVKDANEGVESYSKSQLQTLAKQKGLKGTSKMNKSELKEAIQAA